ncbi:MAG: hypothetical protein K8F91_19230 [Candidatus Obscuribacterales bacterium]|nr:hypothetical protein [Candidatus Obscuribacterales bacterium]
MNVQVASTLALYLYYAVILAGWLVSSTACILSVRKAIAKLPLWRMGFLVAGLAMIVGLFWSSGFTGGSFGIVLLAIAPPILTYAGTLLSRRGVRRTSLLIGLFPITLLSGLILCLTSLMWIEHFLAP